MPDSIRIKEIHACLGAGEYSFYEDDNGELAVYYMHIARNIDYLVKSFGLYYKPDGTLVDIRSNVVPPSP